MWTKALYDLGLITFDEPFKRLLNQGMIQGNSRFVYRLNIGAAHHLLYNILHENFKEYNFKTQSLINKWNHDFYSETHNISFDLSLQKFIENKYSEYKRTAPTHQYIYLSVEEILEFYSKGHERLVLWIKELINYHWNYYSKTNKNLFFISESKLNEFEPYHYDQLHVDVNIVNGVELDIEAFRNSNTEYEDAIFIFEDGSVNTSNSSVGEKQNGKYICGTEVEKMGKSKKNSVNPDNIVDKYGADTFRMYEMFLGPVEMSKPWDTKGIEGVHRFLKKLWRLFINENGSRVTDEKATPEELKVLHKAIKKIEEDTERFSFNTCVSAFMVCVNELTDLKCTKKEILEPLLILLTSYAPHISCELWETIKVSPIGGDLEGAILDANFPKLEQKYLVESTKEYPISVNGKLRTTINIDLSFEQSQVEKIVLQNEVITKWLEGKQPKKIIFVKGKMVNVVL
jgi:leucyl-tRNA synthetase